MASPNLPPDLDSPSPSFPNEFPYEVFHSLPPSSPSSNASLRDYFDENLFFRGLSQRPTPHSLSFSVVPTPRRSTPSPHHCDGFPVARKLSPALTSALGGDGNCSSLAGVSQLPLLVPSHTDRFDLVYAAAALELARLKVESAPFGLLPEQGLMPSSLNHDPFSLPCSAQSTPRGHAREAEFVGQRQEAVLLAQQRLQQIQAQIRAKKLGFAERGSFRRTYSFPQPGRASKAGSVAAGLCGTGSEPVRGCVGTGVFLPRVYGGVAPESHKNSGPGLSFLK